MLAALDGTGFDAGHRSRYFTLRKKQTGTKIKYRKYPYATLVCDTKSKFIFSAHASFGPAPDIKHFRKALKRLPKALEIKDMAADAGYDAEWAHVHAKKKYGIRMIIPPRGGRRTKKLPLSKYRRKMAKRFPYKKYGQRWQLEGVNSVIKKRLGSVIRARTPKTQKREMIVKIYAYNILLLAEAK